MIYLVQADGDLPNIALRRLSAWLRARGEQVRLLRSPDEYCPLAGDPPPTIVYGSSIFEESADVRRAFEAVLGSIVWGGTGVRTGSSLTEIDPAITDDVRCDFSDDPDFDASIGFLTRGCRLRCKFCKVHDEEGAPRVATSVHELWRGEPWPRHLHLLDNDAFAKPLRDFWRDTVAEIRAGGFKVCFSQGLNIRLIDDETAAAIASIPYKGHDFDRARLFTAWDTLGDEGIFRRGVETLRRAGIPPTHLRVYMLIGFDPAETWEARFYRHTELVALGCEPYPMAYKKATRPDLAAFAKWGGGAAVQLYKRVPWPEFRCGFKGPARAESNAAWSRVAAGWRPAVRRLPTLDTRGVA